MDRWNDSTRFMLAAVKAFAVARKTEYACMHVFSLVKDAIQILASAPMLLRGRCCSLSMTS